LILIYWMTIQYSSIKWCSDEVWYQNVTLPIINTCSLIGNLLNFIHGILSSYWYLEPVMKIKTNFAFSNLVWTNLAKCIVCARGSKQTLKMPFPWFLCLIWKRNDKNLRTIGSDKCPLLSDLTCTIVSYVALRCQCERTNRKCIIFYAATEL
jgi:hypothetical protein